MKKILYIFIITALLISIGLMWKQGGGGSTCKDDLICVEVPKPGTLVKSPLVVRGEARGNWYFEASFPVRLLDSEGREIAVNIAQAQSDWMTTEFVPFETKLIFITPSSGQTGTLVLQKDNPSGLPENEDELRIPVRFQENSAKTRIIKLFYYNEDNDKDASGNILCSDRGLEAVERQIPITITPIQDAIKLLLQGELTFTEQSSGIDTEFPLSGVSLTSASLTNGSLTLTFADPGNKTSGGSCRVNILRAQIEATAKQFSEVKKVFLAPEELFQP